MIYIGVCIDDNDRIYNMLANYMERQEFLYKIVKLTSSEELMQTSTIFHLLIVDTVINGADGIEIARKIKERNKSMVVIFVTNHRTFIFRAVNEVHPFAYLSENIEEGQFIRHLEELKSYISYKKRNKELIRLKLIDITKEGMIGHKYKNFVICDILCFEYVNRKIKICLDHEEYYFYDTLKHISEQMKPYCFESCHKSCLVNLEHVKQLKGHEIILDNGKILRISQKKACDFRKKLKTYFLNRKQKINF